MTSGDSPVEPDHLFVLVRAWRDGQGDVAAADELSVALEASGFRASTHRRHPGQGTENRCFRFDGFLLELLFLVSREEAGDERTRPLELLARRDDPACSPFGVASRPIRAAPVKPSESPPGSPAPPVVPPGLPWATDLYRPAYLPPDVGIPIARDVPPRDPLWFHLPFAASGESRRAAFPEEAPHPNGASRLDAVAIAQPTPPSAASAFVAGRLGVALGVGAAHRMTLRFDGGAQGREIVPHPHLPLSIEC